MATKTQQEDTVVLSLYFGKVKGVLPARYSATKTGAAVVSSIGTDSKSMSAAAAESTEVVARPAPRRQLEIGGPLALMGCRR